MNRKKTLAAHELPDTHQSFWQLASIQLTGIASLPVLAASVLILQHNNLPSALLTIIIGNILLWLIRWGIISMSHDGRKSSLDISRDYLGNFGSYFIAILLLLSTLAWFIAQTTLATNALTYLVPIQETGVNRYLQMSVALGIVSTLLCMEGIVLLRWVAIISFPILVIAFVIILFTSTSPPLSAPAITGISLSGLPLILGTSLGVTVDLPTFFRHSRSKKDSIQALTVIQILSLALGIGGLFLGSVISPWLGVNESNGFILNGPLLKTALIALIFVSVICANISNVYSASVGWELVAPILAGRKEYLILGLGLSTIYILVANVFNLELLLNATDISLVNLCFILLIGYLITYFTKRKPSPTTQLTYFSAWLLATIINILQYTDILSQKISPLLLGLFILLLTTSCSYAYKRLFLKKTKS